jgi:hypothetical protein
MDSSYTFVNGVQAYEVKVIVDEADAKELVWTVIADGFADCVETTNERLHDLGLTPYALKSIIGFPRIILTEKAHETLGDIVC